MANVASALTSGPIGERRCARRGHVAVEYFISGRGPTVVMLPALASTVEEFNPLANALVAAGFRTLGVHFVGIGASQRPRRPRATLDDFADDIVLAIEDAGLPAAERVCLLGRALGNRVARVFATRWPARTAGVVLLAAGSERRGRGGLAALGRYLKLQWPWLSLASRRRLLESLLCMRRDVLPEGVCQRPPLRAFLPQASAARRSDWRVWRGGGTAPMLVLQGEQDLVADPQLARDLQRDFPNRVQLEMIPNAGHGLLFDAPEIVTDRVLKFVRLQMLQNS